MDTLRSTLAPQRRFAWLLWLVLLLPLAQGLATSHAYSHDFVFSGSAVPGSSGTSRAPAAAGVTLNELGDQPAPHAGHCDLCLTAASVVGGALAGEPAAWALRAPRFALPHTADVAVWTAPPAPAYRSRAPPFSPR